MPWRGARARGGARAYARAALPSRRLPWRQGRYCVLDLELSGLDPRRHEIIAVGAVPVDDGRVRLDGAISSLVAPTGPLAEESIRVHGIRRADLDDAPALEVVIDALLDAMAGRVLVAHYARIERAFLAPQLRRARVRLRGPVIDTAELVPLWLVERDGAPPKDLSLSGLARAASPSRARASVPIVWWARASRCEAAAMKSWAVVRASPIAVCGE